MFYAKKDKFGNDLYEDDYVIDRNNKQGKI